MPELSELYQVTSRIDLDAVSDEDVKYVTGRMRVLNVLKEEVSILEKEVLDVLRKYDKTSTQQR